MPAAVEALVLATLAKKPEERPQTMQDVVAAIDRAARAALPGQSVAALPRELLSGELGEGLASAAASLPAVKAHPSSLTTLRATTAEVAGVPRGSRRLAIAAGGAALLVVVAVLALRSPGSKEAGGRAAGPAAPAVTRPAPVPPPPAPAPPPTPAAAAPVPAPPAAATPPPGVPAERELVKIGIESEPPGAEVTDPETSAVLGDTPFSGTFPRGDGVVRLSVSLDGYATKVTTFSLTKDTSVVVRLAKRSARRGKDDDQESIRKL